MFDFRYHVASLAAVFFALVIGILVGVALASHGARQHRARAVGRRSAARGDQARRAQGPGRDAQSGAAADRAFVERTDKSVMAEQAEGEEDRRALHRFVGQGSPFGDHARSHDAGAGAPLRITVRAGPDRSQESGAKLLRTGPSLAKYAGRISSENLGHDLGQEFVAGTDTPMWNALQSLIVEEKTRSGEARRRTASSSFGRPRRRRADSALPPGPLRGSRATPAFLPSASSARSEAVSAIKAFQQAQVSRPLTTSTADREARTRAPARRAAPGRKLRHRETTGSAGDAARLRRRVDEPLTILVAARDEEAAIGTDGDGAAACVPRRGGDRRRRRLARPHGRGRRGGGRNRPAAAAPRQGPGAVRRRSAPRRRARCSSATPISRGDLAPLLERRTATSTSPPSPSGSGGGFGIAKRVARELIGGSAASTSREPLSGQRALSPAAERRCFPVAAGFGCEVRMTIDAARAGLRSTRSSSRSSHRATGRDVARLRAPRPAARRQRSTPAARSG